MDFQGSCSQLGIGPNLIRTFAASRDRVKMKSSAEAMNTPNASTADPLSHGPTNDLSPTSRWLQITRIEPMQASLATYSITAANHFWHDSPQNRDKATRSAYR